MSGGDGRIVGQHRRSLVPAGISRFSHSGGDRVIWDVDRLQTPRLIANGEARQASSTNCRTRVCRMASGPRRVARRPSPLPVAAPWSTAVADRRDDPALWRLWLLQHHRIDRLFHDGRSIGFPCILIADDRDDAGPAHRDRMLARRSRGMNLPRHRRAPAVSATRPGRRKSRPPQ